MVIRLQICQSLYVCLYVHLRVSMCVRLQVDLRAGYVRLSITVWLPSGRPSKFCIICMYTCLYSVYLHDCLSACLPVCLHISSPCIFFFVYACPSVCLNDCLPICPFNRLFQVVRHTQCVYVCMCVPICLCILLSDSYIWCFNSLLAFFIFSYYNGYIRYIFRDCGGSN